MTKNLHTKKHKPRFGALAVALAIAMGFSPIALFAIARSALLTNY